MKASNVQTPNYSNWVSSKFVYIPGIISLVFFGLMLIFPLLMIVAIFFGLIAIYFAYAYYRFSPAGGNIQARIQDLVLSNLDWDGNGKALDIGCGNAPLSINLAKKYPHAQIKGIDFWGEAWDYSKGVCEQNAGIEGVADRVTFQKASAAALPFEDESFDAAVSNLVFHEVSDAKDKREVIYEALRVVRRGGRFAFQDLFLWKQVYGETDDLIATIKSWGISKVEFIPTCDEAFIPAGLKLPFMVGTLGILYGDK
jgi:SAM-dependent methyltransferase